MTQLSQSETRSFLFARTISYVGLRKLGHRACIGLVFPLVLTLGCSSSKDKPTPPEGAATDSQAGAENPPDFPPESEQDAPLTASDSAQGTSNNTDNLRIPTVGNDPASSVASSSPNSDTPASDNDAQDVIGDPYGTKNPSAVAAEKAFVEPADSTRLAPDANLWVDVKLGRVIVDGYVALREGPLEMFACPMGSKEHESVVAVLSKSRYVQAALLAVGAVQGTPVAFDPEYRPATGQRIAIWVMWKDNDGKIQKSKAQQWVENTGTNKALDQDWVFGGSSFWTEPETGKEYYQADSGDLICVSNFTTATLDLPVESSATNAALQYSAFTQNIPPGERRFASF
jgi:hypothetical protein